MRLSDLQALIIERLEAIAVDDPQSVADVFRHDPDQTDDEVRPERSFLLLQGQISPTTTFGPSIQASTMQAQFFYVDNPGASKRVADDGERVLQCLYWLHTVHADVQNVVALGDWVPGPGAQTSQIVCTVDFTVAYQVDVLT